MKLQSTPVEVFTQRNKGLKGEAKKHLQRTKLKLLHNAEGKSWQMLFSESKAALCEQHKITNIRAKALVTIPQGYSCRRHPYSEWVAHTNSALTGNVRNNSRCPIAQALTQQPSSLAFQNVLKGLAQSTEGNRCRNTYLDINSQHDCSLLVWNEKLECGHRIFMLRGHWRQGDGEYLYVSTGEVYHHSNPSTMIPPKKTPALH